METLSQRWACMDAEQRLQFHPQDPAPAAAEPDVAPPSKPWPYISDDFYPISEQSLLDLPTRVGQMNAAWKSRVGSIMGDPAVAITSLKTNT
eukprot:6734729-Pyramimonas_sp.AAC.1